MSFRRGSPRCLAHNPRSPSTSGSSARRALRFSSALAVVRHRRPRPLRRRVLGPRRARPRSASCSRSRSTARWARRPSPRRSPSRSSSSYGIPEVVVVQVAASLAADLIRTPPVDRIVFNLAQLAISWVARRARARPRRRHRPPRRHGPDGERPPRHRARRRRLLRRQLHARPHRRGASPEVLDRRPPPRRPRLPQLVRRHPVRARPAGCGRRRALALPRPPAHAPDGRGASRVASRRPRWSTSPSTTRSPRSRTARCSSRRSARALGVAPARRVQETALLVVDLDRFRDVNDTLGRAQGDTVLKEVAARLKRSVSATDLVARVEGDRFGILLSERPAHRRRRARRPEGPHRAEPPLRRGGRVAERRRHRRHRLRAHPRARRRPPPPARRGRHVPRQARAVALRVLLARHRGRGAAPADPRHGAQARDRRPLDHDALPAEVRARDAAAWSGSRRSPAGPTRSSAPCCPPPSSRSPSAPASPSRSPSSRSRSPPPTPAAGSTTASTSRSP